VGLQVPRRSYYAKELTVTVSRSYGPGRYDPGYEEAGLDYPIGYVRWTEGRNLQAFVDLLGWGEIEVSSLISHRFPLATSTQAYTLIRGRQSFLGMLITYPEAGAKSLDKKLVVSGKPISKDNVGIGLLGAGNFARHTLLPTLKGMRGLEFIGVASASGRAAAELAKRYGFRYASSDGAQILKDKKVDVVAVLTRHHLHASQTLAALKAGKRVFCEKPLALNERELDSIEKALAKENSPLLTIGFNLPYDSPEAMRDFARRFGIDTPDWEFLTPYDGQLEGLTRDLGFSYARTAWGFDHITQVTVVDQDGSIYRQVYGDSFPIWLLIDPLKELIEGTPVPIRSVGDFIERVRILCTLYDPRTNTYRFKTTVIGEIASFAMITIALVWFVWHERRRRRKAQAR